MTMPSETSEPDKKQNGSVHDDDSKARTRVSRACTRCRARKDRCDGLRPSCSACRTAQAVCCYEPATKKRGLPEGYVRGLEKLLALLIGKVEGLEDAASHLMHEHRSELLKIWNHPSVGEELHTTWKESKIIQELENLLGGLDQSTSTGQKRKREHNDEGDDVEEDIDLTFHTKSQYSISRISEAYSAAVSNRPSSANTVEEVELPPNAIELVDHYFAHTHCWFPIVDRPQVLRACYELSRGKSHANKNESMSSLLWAIFAYTSRHVKHAHKSGHQNEPDSNSGIDYRYRAAARAKIPSDAQSLTQMHAQSSLVLALLDIGLGKWKSAWTLVGQAIRIVLCDASEAKNSRRNDSALFQGCAVLDIAIASHLGVVPHLRRSDFETRPLMNEDGYEEWEPWTAPGFDQGRSREPSFATSCFNRLTEVFLINADVLTILSQPEKIDRTYVQALLGKLHHLQTMVPGVMPPSLQSPPHHIYLQLCHVLVQMRLVDLPVETGAGGLERAKLACNVLGLLELCKNVKAVGLEHVPPFLVDCIEMACRLARSSASSFGAASGLPSYHEFNRTASELVSSMADSWSVYSTVSHQQRSNSHPLSHVETPPSRTNVVISPHPHSSPSTSDLTAQRRMRGSFETSQRQNSTPLTSQPAYSSENVSLPDLNNWQYPTGQTPFTMPNVNSAQFGAAGPGSSGNEQNMNMGNIVGLDMSGGTPTGPLGLAIPEPSPSFQGDEIDAIFHEMAHLDTNEWTSERALGLRDFGFTDDLTFQAFCNDPERLVAPGDGLQPALSSNSQTWTFADPNSSMG